MNIKIIETQIPGLLPLGVNRPCGDIRLCGKSWRKLMRHRWVDALGKSCVLHLNTSISFWPSYALLEQLASLKDGFRVLNATGEILASGTTAPVTNALGISIENMEEHHESAGKSVDVMVDAESIVVQHPWDLLDIQDRVLEHAPHGRNNGIIHEGSVIDGNVDLGDGSIILPGVCIFGNVIIGENCEIGPNCCIRGNTAIGDRCRIGQGAEVSNSIIMDDVRISHVSYVGDSIVSSGVDIGAGTMIASYRHDGDTVKSMVAGKLVDTGRRQFGAVFAENVRTGINTAILPGRKIAANHFTCPGDIIRHDLE